MSDRQPRSESRREDLLTRKEAAAYLGVSRSWLARRKPGMDGPKLLRLGGKVLYRLQDLNDYLDNCVIGGEEWDCMNIQSRSTGGPASATPVPSIGGRVARETVERLRRSLVEFEPTSKQRNLSLVEDSD